MTCTAGDLTEDLKQLLVARNRERCVLCRENIQREIDRIRALMSNNRVTSA